MPRDDAVSAASVDFRIQKTQVRMLQPDRLSDRVVKVTFNVRHRRLSDEIFAGWRVGACLCCLLLYADAFVCCLFFFFVPAHSSVQEVC